MGISDERYKINCFSGSISVIVIFDGVMNFLDLIVFLNL